MQAETHTEFPLPRLEELGTDLLTTTPWQRWIALARPVLWGIVYIVAMHFRLWYLAPILVFLTFVAVVNVTHDIVHGTIGLTKNQTEIGLFVMGAIIVESGHAYRTTHQQHHRVFPKDDDPEGEPAHMSVWGAIASGPTFLLKLWFWAFRRQSGNLPQRRWLLLEAVYNIAVIVTSFFCWHTCPTFTVYVAIAIVGSWLYPFLNVYFLHHDFGDTPLYQTHTVRGRIIPPLFLELTYHLEHHLYPQVPSHNVPKLAQRLDPLFDKAGVKPMHVI